VSQTIAAPGVSLADQVQRCRRAQAAWAGLSVAQRLRPVRALRHLLVAAADDLCEATARDLGKTPAEALGGDVLPLADACRFLERRAARLLRPHKVPSGLRPLWLWGQGDVVHRRPRGLIGLIGTWNYPVFLNGVALVQALAAGNGVLWKPSEVAPASAAALFRLLEQAGFPAGLVQLLDATREAGRQLAEEADVDHVAFTGSSATGRALAATLGRRLISSTLELSGCDAMFVLDDADVALAARAAWFGATLNRGQTCLAVRRAFVHRSLYPAFVDALRRSAATARPVPTALPAQREQARRLVRQAVDEGGRLLDVPAGEEPADACLPRVVLDARPEMALCREATFAPLVAVLPFETVDEALRGDAQCPYGLGASVFTRDPKRAAALAPRLRAGAVTVNDVVAPTTHPATPFGGVGESGWGRTQGEEGLLEMTVSQVVSVRRGTFRPHYDLATGSASAGEDMLRGFLDFGHAPRFGQRLAGLWRMLGAAWRYQRNEPQAPDEARGS
jgi:acyl-CoA reductase-like NAD-dependent aldehyde dehydrogenase